MLLGEPNRSLSTRSELRYGRKGSLVISVTSGRWFDHEKAIGGGVLAFIQHVNQITRPEAAVWLANFNQGALPQSVVRRHLIQPMIKPGDRSAWPLALWNEATSAVGTLAERYLWKRSLTLWPCAEEVIRFHRKCPFGRERLACLIALMRDIRTGQPIAIQRTALNADGTKVGRKMLGPTACAAVMLVENTEVTFSLGVAEGLETALSVIQSGWSPVWALGSAGAIDRFPVLPVIDRLTVFADPDDAGVQAAYSCAKRWADAGRDAIVQVPSGGDFNDRLCETLRG